MKDIIVYGTISCGKCKQLKEMCEETNLRFTYATISNTDSVFQKLVEAGVKSFPVIGIDNDFYFSKPLDDMMHIIQANQ